MTFREYLQEVTPSGLLTEQYTCVIETGTDSGHYRKERERMCESGERCATAARDRPRKTAIIVAAHEAVFTPASPAPPGTELIILKRMNEAVGRPIKNRSRRVHAPAKRRESWEKLRRTFRARGTSQLFNCSQINFKSF